jgi:hypothetical protein
MMVSNDVEDRFGGWLVGFVVLFTMLFVLHTDTEKNSLMKIVKEHFNLRHSK